MKDCTPHGKERQLNAMWKAISEWKECDGTCPICTLSRVKFHDKWDRSYKEKK